MGGPWAQLGFVNECAGQIAADAYLDLTEVGGGR
jgi:hypothetical protein